MTNLVLAGCRTTPLGGYLGALGLLRAVTRLLDPAATGRWERRCFVLGSRFATSDDLVDALLPRFEPEAIVSPWNGGSGFAGNGKSVTAERALQAVRDSTDPRLAPLRAAVQAGDRVVVLGRERGWGGKGDNLWDEAGKLHVLLLCRNEFPDQALPWLDAAVALGPDGEHAYSRLLGTGGNFGRQDLSATYLARLQSVLTDRRSRGWLHAMLTGDESTPYLRDAVGQFDPGRAGGIQSSPLGKTDDKGFVNPWAFLLTVEGALLFATAVVRRHGADYGPGHGKVALPFQVRGSAVGHATVAAGENALGELWAPEWSAPTRLDEVTHLLAEGRAEWQARPARSGLDFARAVATLGVDRGIAAFERYLFVDRLGQNPLAVPAGRIEVTQRRGVELLAELDSWLDDLRRTTLPSTVDTRIRGVEQALFAHARSGEPAALAEVFVALGRCHESVARSGSVQRAVRPLVLRNGDGLLGALLPAAHGDGALRVALALATARDGTAPPTLGGLRPLLAPVAADRMPRWTSRPVPASLATGLAAALAEVARLRGMPGAVDDPPGDLVPAVRGVRIALHRGLVLRAADAAALVDGSLDGQRCADVLAGLLTVDWPRTDRTLPGDGNDADPALDVLLPFTGTGLLRVPTDSGTKDSLVRPGPQWPVLLAAGRIAEVLGDAARRLRIAGLRHVIDPRSGDRDGMALAAVLLLRISDPDRAAALRRVAALPQAPPNQEITP